METFLVLISKIVPLYLLIVIGFFTKKYSDISKETVGRLLIYIIAPAVVFLGTSTAQINLQFFILPILFFAVGTITCLINYHFGSKLWKDGTEKILAFASGTGNTGYFGLPVCLALFGDDALPIVVTAIFGLILFENTVGFYVVARSSHSVKQAILKTIKLPTLYAFLIGIIVNLLHVNMSIKITEVLELLKGGYIPLGMMMIGFGLAEAKINHFDLKFTVIGLFNKFIIWPALFLLFIYLDKNYFHLYSPLIYSVLLIEASTPVAANTVSYAAVLKAHPEKAALLVTISTVIALFFIPMVVVFLALN